MASFSAICTFLGTGTVRTFGLAFAGHRIVWVVGTQTNIKNSNLKMCFSSTRYAIVIIFLVPRVLGLWEDRNTA